jgi:hypothetical protein
MEPLPRTAPTEPVDGGERRESVRKVVPHILMGVGGIRRRVLEGTRESTMQKQTRRLLTGAVALAAVPGIGLATAQSTSATTSGVWSSQQLSSCCTTVGSNEWVAHGGYKAFFEHTGPEGETLKVWNPSGDGDAAVAYVQFAAQGDPDDIATDSDRFVVSEHYHNFNLREYDSGPYDVREDFHVYIKICRGYASIPGDNCDGYDTGVS